MEFNKKLTSLREQHNLTKTELAKRLNITTNKLTSFEKGKSKPDFDTMLDICKVFNIDINEMLKDLDEATSQTDLKPLAKSSHLILMWIVILILFIILSLYLIK